MQISNCAPDKQFMHIVFVHSKPQDSRISAAINNITLRDTNLVLKAGAGLNP
jgi:hypothetical protein